MESFNVWRPKEASEEEMRAEWLDHKRGFISASEAAAAIGESPWQTPDELYLIKTGRKEPEDISGHEAVQYGIQQEPIIREHFIANHPELDCQYHPFDFYTSTERPWLGCTLDLEGVAKEDTDNFKKGEECVIEFKTGSFRSAKDLEKWDGCPLYYTIQVLTQMAVRGAHFGFLYAELRYTGDKAYQGKLPDIVPVEYYFRHNEAAEKELLERLDKFHGRLMEDRMPETVIEESRTTVVPVAQHAPVEIEADVEIGRFTQNFALVKDAIIEMVEPYRGVSFTEEQYRDAKEIAADLNKKIDAIESKRKAVKKKYTKPLEEFESLAKELTRLITDVRQPIVEQIAAFDEAKKEAKRADIEEVMEKHAALLNEYESPFWQTCGGFTFDQKWLNVSVKMKAIEADIESQVLKFKSDFKALAEFADNDETIRIALLNEYARTRDISAAISAKKRILDARAADEARRKAMEKPLVIKAEETPYVYEQPSLEEIPTPPQTKTVTFRVKVTAQQNRALASWLKSNGFSFEVISIE